MLTLRTFISTLLLTGCMLALAGPAPADDLVLAAGSLRVTVSESPFDLRIERDGMPLIDTAATGLDGRRPGPLAFAIGANADAHQLGYSVTGQAALRWLSATTVQDARASGDRLQLTLATEDPTRTIGLQLRAVQSGLIRVEASLSDSSGVIGMGAAFDNTLGERFLGFGERSDGADQTGREVVTWNEEGPFSAGDTAPVADPLFGDRWQGPLFFPGSNFTMPWFVSSKGYGFLLDSDWLNGFDLGASDTAVWTVTTREPALRFEIYDGPTPAAALQRYTAASGRQPEPVAWYFGPWLQPGPTPEEIRAADLPVTVAQTYTHYLPCAAQSGNRQAQRDNTARWHAQGFRVTTYVNSFVCSGHPDGAYAEGDETGYFIRHPVTGGTYPAPYVAYVKQDGPYHGIVDFTNPAAAEWWRGLIREAIEDGYDGWMEDFGEYVPVDAQMADGRNGLQYHNRYCTDYHAASHALTDTEQLNEQGFAQFIRCGYTGTAPYARIVWGADPSEDFSKADGLAAAVSQGISMGLSGIAYWGSDIGGFHAIQHLDRTDAELQSRWLQFGAFSGIMRTQKTGYPRPALGPVETYRNERAEVYGEAVAPVFRKYAKLRTQLFPYIWRAARQYQDSGLPIMRHLGLIWPEDPRVWSAEAEYQFMFGDDLLVAPVISDGARERTLYLPPGEWVDFWQAIDYDEDSGAFTRNRDSAEIVYGGQLLTVAAPLDQIPIFVRAGSCIKLLPADVDTLASIGLDAEGVRGLAEVGDNEMRPLRFGRSSERPGQGNCGG